MPFGVKLHEGLETWFADKLSFCCGIAAGVKSSPCMVVQCIVGLQARSPLDPDSAGAE